MRNILVKRTNCTAFFCYFTSLLMLKISYNVLVLVVLNENLTVIHLHGDFKKASGDCALAKIIK